MEGNSFARYTEIYNSYFIAEKLKEKENKMKVLITKADDDYWYSFATFETFNDLISYKENAGYDLTISDNFWYREDVEEIFKAWAQEDNNFTMKDAYSISECKYEILIENSEY